jgi:hypothetical protein
MKENVAHNRKAMLIGGIYTIVTAKVPSVLGGGGVINSSLLIAFQSRDNHHETEQ